MKFSIGDKILLKRTGEEGTVCQYINSEMLEVEVNGTHFPVYMDEVEHPYLKWFTERNKDTKKPASLPEQLPVEKQSARPKKPASGIYLSFLPVFKTAEMEDIVSELKVYLINETEAPIDFSYEQRFFNETEFSHQGSLHSFGHLYLHTIAYEDMNDQPSFIWKVNHSGRPEYREETGILKIRPSKLFRQIQELLLKNEPTFRYLLLESLKEELKPAKPAEKKFVIPKSKTEGPKPAKFSSFAEIPRFEVDLHMEQLTEDYKNMSNSEMLQIQLETFERYLHLAIMHHQEKLIVIHGVGTGVLRKAVHEILRKTPEVAFFSNHYMGHYGFGATEVLFKR